MAFVLDDRFEVVKKTQHIFLLTTQIINEDFITNINKLISNTQNGEVSSLFSINGSMPSDQLVKECCYLQDLSELNLLSTLAKINNDMIENRDIVSSGEFKPVFVFILEKEIPGDYLQSILDIFKTGRISKVCRICISLNKDIGNKNSDIATHHLSPFFKGYDNKDAEEVILFKQVNNTVEAFEYLKALRGVILGLR